MAIQGSFRMPYTSVISKNHKEGRTKAGKPFTKPEAKKWMNSLQHKVAQWVKSNAIVIPSDCQWEVKLVAYFPVTGGRAPDTHNYLEAPIDAIAKGLKIDDNWKRVPAGSWDSSPAPEGEQGTLVYWVTIYDEERTS